MKKFGVPLWMKMAMGSVAILLLFGISVAFCILNLNSIAKKVSLYNKSSQLADNLYAAQDYQGTYLLQQADSTATAFRATITDVIRLIADLGPEVSDATLLDHLKQLKSNITKYNQEFDSVVANTQQIQKHRQSMTQAYETITELLATKVKAPLEEKKNQALILGDEISAYEQELLSLTDRLYTLMATTRLNENNFFMRSDPEDGKRVVAGMDSAHATFEEWSFIIGTYNDKEMQTYPPILKQKFDRYKSEIFNQIKALWIDNHKITSSMLKQKDVGLELIKTFQTETATMVEAAKNSALKSIVALLLIGLVVGIGISILTGLGISRPIRNIVSMLKDIAEGEGDLTRRLEVNRSDELGEQANCFNVFVEKIHSMIREISGITQDLNGSSTLLSNLASQMSEGAGHMETLSNTASTSTEEMSESIHSVATTMEQASKNVEMIVYSAQEMTATIQEIAQNSENARVIAAETVSQTQTASKEVDQLGEAAREIGKVTETITEISEQTNLLALNATIEAARAGEAGKGFAVVANEIKQLATQTAEATNEIKSRVENIQHATNGSVKRIGEISNVINEVNTIITSISAAIEQQSAATTEITDNVTQASAGLNQINRHITQSAIKAESISGDISQVDQSASQISEGSAQLDQNTKQLLALSEQLKKLVDKFVID